jgi:CheY-like chemotaxis protein
MSDKPKTILLAEDDPDDIYLISEAIDESGLHAHLVVVENGVELLDYLCQRGRFSQDPEWQFPDLVLLDLNMPLINGREALAAMKSDSAIRSVPVVVLTTSNAQVDLEQSYDQGASGFITKPAGFSSLRDIIGQIGSYWLQTVSLPEKTDQEDEKQNK